MNPAELQSIGEQIEILHFVRNLNIEFFLQGLIVERSMLK
jgi:hypothetical protein